MAKLVANECVNCRIPAGYVTEEALQIPTMCVLCAADEEVMAEWEHEVEGNVKLVLGKYRSKIHSLIGYGE